jgi:hypothetical protein
MPTLTHSLLIGWNRNLAYAQRLIADLDQSQMDHQPQPGMNHPAWVFAHLTAYHPVLEGLIIGQTPDDPRGHRFGMGSTPEADPDGKVYGGKAELVAGFSDGHAAVETALRAATDDDLARPMPIERWAEPFPTVGDSLGYLMLVHESTHLGQLSAWRRVQGLPSV